MKKILLFLIFISAYVSAQVYKPTEILIFSKNSSWAYRHASIEYGVKQVKTFLEKKGFKVYSTENASVFNEAELSKYQAIVFLSANQDIFNAAEEKALQRYVRAGGGIVGIHSSSGVERNWPWFNKMMGATFIWHPAQQTAKLKIVDSKHPSTKHLPKTWERMDEWYYFGKIKNPIKPLIVLDSSTFKSDKHTQNYPNAWFQNFENGKVFYTAGGHNEKDFDDPLFMNHIYGGIQSVLCKKLNYDLNTSFMKPPATLVTLDPAHFHAALVQKIDQPRLNPKVKIYANEGPDLTMHLNRIKGYNERKESPSHWQSDIKTSANFFEDYKSNKEGDIVVLAGNNKDKMKYIMTALEKGQHVLADKPMCINAEGYEELKKAFSLAKEKEVLLYDIMTERSEITTLLQKELSLQKGLFGTYEKGSPDNPSIIKESVHHFYKMVSGSPLIRPAWFMDTEQQGKGIIDVTTHLIDLVHWTAFPEIPLNITDASITGAKTWKTHMSLPQFSKITGLNNYPDYLNKNVNPGNVLEVESNGEINFKLKDIHAKVKVLWNYEAAPGALDYHYSILKGTGADLEIRQGEAEKFVPQLFIKDISSSENEVKAAFEVIKSKFAGVDFEKTSTGYKVLIPEKLRTGHEAHFAEVLDRFLDYYEVNNLPDWERTNMILKYYISTKALEKATKF